MKEGRGLTTREYRQYLRERARATITESECRRRERAAFIAGAFWNYRLGAGPHELEEKAEQLYPEERRT